MISSIASGKTQVFGVIGQPIAHSFSPIIHNTIAKALHDDLLYAAFPVLPNGLEDAVKGAFALGIGGLNVTLPHKPFVLSYLSGLDETAKACAAANTLKRTEQGYVGYNTDVMGVLQTLRAQNIDMHNKKATVLGAGGSARAVCVALMQAGCSTIYLANRTKQNAQALFEELKPKQETANVEIIPLSIQELERLYVNKTLPQQQLLVNTTTSGFGTQQDQMPIDAKVLNQFSALLDIIYTPWETKLLHVAKQQGILCMNGFPMLVYQAVASYEIWLEKKLDSGFVLDLLQNTQEYFLTNSTQVC